MRSFDDHVTSEVQRTILYSASNERHERAYAEVQSEFSGPATKWIKENDYSKEEVKRVWDQITQPHQASQPQTQQPTREPASPPEEPAEEEEQPSQPEAETQEPEETEDEAA